MASSSNAVQGSSPEDSNSLSSLQAFIKSAEWEKEDTINAIKWENLECTIGEGSGQNLSKYSVTGDKFKTLCKECGFSDTLLSRLRSRESLFEHTFNFGSAEGTTTTLPTTIEIAVASYEIDAFLALFQCKLDSGKPGKAHFLVFAKANDYLKETDLTRGEIGSWIERNKSLIDKHPIMVLNVVLALMIHRVKDYLRLRIETNDIEARVGRTKHIETLKSLGYAEISYDFDSMISDLGGLAKIVTDIEMSVSTTMLHARSLQRVVRICEQFERSTSLTATPPCNATTEQQEELEATITRAELFLVHVKRTQDILQSLTSLLYNRISASDTQAMKTIATVTLVFLPATFISAVFSVGIFDFNALESPTHHKVVSSYGWVYLFLCLMITSLTIAVWWCFHLWGALWLDKHRKLKRTDTSIWPSKRMKKTPEKPTPKKLTPKNPTRVEPQAADEGQV